MLVEATSGSVAVYSRNNGMIGHVANFLATIRLLFVVTTKLYALGKVFLSRPCSITKISTFIDFR